VLTPYLYLERPDLAFSCGLARDTLDHLLRASKPTFVFKARETNAAGRRTLQLGYTSQIYEGADKIDN
jgi:hypothetical protein